MADIRDNDNQTFGQLCPNSPLARSRATSSDRASDLLIAQIGAGGVAANVAANNARRWAIQIFGRLHNQQFDDQDTAQDVADKMGGKLIDTWQQ